MQVVRRGSLRAIRLLNLRRARLQPLRVVVTVIAVAAGVALPVSILVLTSSVTQSVDEFGRRLAGPTPLRIIGPTNRGGVAASVVDTVEATPGVAGAVPLVQAVTLAEPAGGGEPFTIVALGIDCRVERLLGPFGCDPAAVAAAADDAGPLVSPGLARRLGSNGRIRTDLGRVPAGPPLPRVEGFNQDRVAVFPMPVAQRQFLRNAAVDVVYVEPERGVDVESLRRTLERRVGDWNRVLDATEPPPEVGLIYQLFVPLFGMVAVFGMAVGCVLVFNTLSLSLEERRRQLAVTGALGASPRLVGAGTLIEMGTLGLVGGLVGTAGGVLLGGPITGSLGAFSETSLGIPIDVHTEASTIVIGSLLGLVLAGVASIVPIRRALRLDVAAELSNREARAEARPGIAWRRTAVFSTVVVVGLVLSWASQRNGAIEPWQVTAGPIGFALVCLGLMVAIGPVAVAILQLLRHRLVRGNNAARRLGMANLVRDPGRTGIMAQAVGAAVLVAFLVASYSRSVHDGLEANLLRSRQDWVGVTNLDVNNTVNIDAKLTPDLLQRIRAVPGVAAAHREVSVVVGHDPGELRAVTGWEDPWLDGKVIRGTADPDRLRAGEVVVGPAVARDGVRPGDTMRLPTANGFVDVPVQGVWDQSGFNGNQITMDVTQIERLFGPQPPGNLTLRPEPGISPEELANRVRAAELDPALEVFTPDELVGEISASVEGILQPFWAIQRTLMLVAFVAVLSTLLLAGVQRRREMALLAAVGMRPQEMTAMVLSEAGTVGVTATALAVFTGILSLASFLWITPLLLGFRDPFRLDLVAYAVYGAITMVIVLAAAAIPAWRASRLEVVEALQYE